MLKQIVVFLTAIIIIAAIGLLAYWPINKTEPVKEIEKAVLEPKNGTYIVEGKSITLKDGYSEETIVEDSASKLITRYFGDDIKADFNNDEIEDTAFILTQDSGGTGIFYYVTALLSKGESFIGTNAILIGDRIAPQNIEFNNSMLVVNYTDRKPGEPFVTQPSVGTSKYFKVIDNSLKEIELLMQEPEARAIAEKSCIKGGEALGLGSYNENSKTWWFDANLNAKKPGCNPACVVSAETKKTEINWRCTGLITP